MIRATIRRLANGAYVADVSPSDPRANIITSRYAPSLLGVEEDVRRFVDRKYGASMKIEWELPEESPVKPVVEIRQDKKFNFLCWDAIPGADGYIVSVNDEGHRFAPGTAYEDVHHNEERSYAVRAVGPWSDIVKQPAPKKSKQRIVEETLASHGIYGSQSVIARNIVAALEEA